ncbi:MAG TPA: hypothetical protein VGO55_17080 [Allosphingosinicella sp.]|jgi:hypothetical protein|nr:hypothetical protein [Allosphingosinicella sp.]
MRLIAILLAFCLAAPALAQTPEESARIAWVVQRGRALFEIDRAAWVTTDDLRERVGDLGRAGVRGWTVERDGAGYRVAYYTGEGDARAVLYRARVENNRVASAELIPAGARPSLTELQRRIADARGAAAHLGRRSCTGPGFNVAAIPPERPDGPLDLYLLTPQVREAVYPAGGHYLATLAPGGEIVAQRAFTNSCIELTTAVENGNTPAALMVTHLLDKVPTEIHVFLSIWTGLPIYVGTADPQRVWEVTGERISLVDSSN